MIKALTSLITSGQPDLKVVEDRLGRIPGYATLFNAAFADDANPITAQNLAKAVGAFERTLVTPSPFDSYLNGQSDALSVTARAGLKKFINHRLCYVSQRRERGRWHAPEIWGGRGLLVGDRQHKH